MHANLTKFLTDLRASYWFIPSCMLFGAIFLSAGMPWLDDRYGARWLSDINWLTAARTSGARSVLTVIAGSIIGVAGVTFSITVVAVSYASANLGPRLIGNFMRDRGNQATLGVFIGTFVYCLLVLRTVRDASAENTTTAFDAFVPHLSILMALFLALTSVGFLIFFFHHVPETINVGNIAARIGKQLRDEVSDLFPDRTEMHPAADRLDKSWEDQVEILNHTGIGANDEGYIQTLDEKRLAEVAGNHDLLIRVQYRPGDFVIVEDIVLDIWMKDDLDEDVAKNLRACFAIGRRRTPHQNVLFLVDELVEIIARALSPGINDPFTAITCFDWLKVGLASFVDADHRGSKPGPTDPVRIYPITFERFVSRVFDQSRQYVCTDRNVALHVMGLLTEIAARLDDEARRVVILSHLKKLAEACASYHDGSVGAEDIADRYKQAVEILKDPEGYDKYRNSQDWFGGRG